MIVTITGTTITRDERHRRQTTARLPWGEDRLSMARSRGVPLRRDARGDCQETQPPDALGRSTAVAPANNPMCAWATAKMPPLGFLTIS
jgi:hypothetical protein